MRKSRFLALIGLLLGLGSPLGAILMRATLSPLPFPLFLSQEWATLQPLYIYMLMGTCAAFALFGYGVGREEDTLIIKDIGLKKEVLTDPLTGLGNHRFLHDAFKVEFRRHVASRRPISCVMMDLDFFKRVNDNYGHPFGDFVLRQFAVLLRKCIRKGDVATRYGGEEFLCILPNCGKEEARAVAERIRGETEHHVFLNGRRRVKITVSLGLITSYKSSGLNYRRLIQLSDQALYEAKRKGRNRVIQTILGTNQKFQRLEPAKK